MKRTLTTKQLLIDAADFVEKKYNNQRQRINFAEFIEHNEFELALDSLLELADEVEDRFEYGFWQNLEQAASKMKLSDHEKIIKQKITDFRYGNAKGF